MIPPRHVVLTLVAGESPELQRKLAWGVPLPRLSVGTSADWVVTGASVLGQHLLLTFDGYQLQVRAASDTADVRLRGERLGTSWRELGLPFELAFGGGRIAGCAVAASGRSGGAREGAPAAFGRTVAGVRPAQSPTAQSTAAQSTAAESPGTRPPAALPSEAQAETQLFDLSALRASALAPHAILSLGAQASARTAAPRHAAGATHSDRVPVAAPTPPSQGRRAKNPLPFEILSGATLAGPIGALAPRTLGTPNAPAQGRGAAPTLVSSGAAPTGSLSLAQTISDNGASRAYAQRLAAQQHPGLAFAPAALRQRASAVTGAASRHVVVLLPRLGQQRERLSARLRRLTPRQRLLALPGLCCVPALAWLLCSASLSAGSSAASVSPPDAASGLVAPRAPEAAEGHLAIRPPEPVRPFAPGGLPDDAGLAARSAAAATTPSEPTPLARSAFAEADPSGNPPRQRPSLEQEAYRAAFGGNTSHGAALYDELARERGDETFRHAARLMRANRIHKP